MSRPTGGSKICLVGQWSVKPNPWGEVPRYITGGALARSVSHSESRPLLSARCKPTLVYQPHAYTVSHRYLPCCAVAADGSCLNVYVPGCASGTCAGVHVYIPVCRYKWPHRLGNLAEVTSLPLISITQPDVIPCCIGNPPPSHPTLAHWHIGNRPPQTPAFSCQVHMPLVSHS